MSRQYPGLKRQIRADSHFVAHQLVHPSTSLPGNGRPRRRDGAGPTSISSSASLGGESLGSDMVQYSIRVCSTNCRGRDRAKGENQ
jgi:hypothetical protein